MNDIKNSMLTLNTRFSPQDFSVDDVYIEDIAEGLAKSCRYNGQYVGDFHVSVAQHSVYISYILYRDFHHIPEKDRLVLSLIGLLHDGSEGFMQDIVSPIKSELKDYKEIEKRFQNTIYRALIGRTPTLVEENWMKVADYRMLDMESRELGRPTCFENEHWYREEWKTETLFHHFKTHHWWDIKESRFMFLSRFYDLKTSIEVEERKTA